VILWEKKV